MREAKRIPFALDPAQVAVFIGDLLTARDRSIALLMLLGGLRASEVPLLPLANVDFGRRRVRVTGKGGKERVVPVDPSFFTELASYLRTERPAGCSAVECFVVLRGPTTGHALTEAGLRRIFRTHRLRAGTPLVRPHRLRHTYGTNSPLPESTCWCCGTSWATPVRRRPPAMSICGNNAGRGVRGRQITIGGMMSTVTKPLLSPAPGGTDLREDYFRFVTDLSCGP